MAKPTLSTHGRWGAHWPFIRSSRARWSDPPQKLDRIARGRPSRLLAHPRQLRPRVHLARPAAQGSMKPSLHSPRRG